MSITVKKSTERRRVQTIDPPIGLAAMIEAVGKILIMIDENVEGNILLNVSEYCSSLSLDSLSQLILSLHSFVANEVSLHMFLKDALADADSCVDVDSEMAFRNCIDNAVNGLLETAKSKVVLIHDYEKIAGYLLESSKYIKLNPQPTSWTYVPNHGVFADPRSSGAPAPNTVVINDPHTGEPPTICPSTITAEGPCETTTYQGATMSGSVNNKTVVTAGVSATGSGTAFASGGPSIVEGG